MEKKLFSSTAFESLTDVDRRSRLDQMEQELKALLGQCSSSQQFIHRTKSSVEMLRSIGHDLWNIDSDRKTFEIWESEYIRPKLMGRLVVTFKYPNEVHVEWSGTL